MRDREIQKYVAAGFGIENVNVPNTRFYKWIMRPCFLSFILIMMQDVELESIYAE